jgi:RNA polymerase sigma-70 factor (ECF subfamily)
MKIVITESQYNSLMSYNTDGMNMIIESYAGKKLEPLTESWFNALLGIVGIFDPTGIADIANAISFFSQGKKVFALLSLISAIPGTDLITKPLMIGGKIIASISNMKVLGVLFRFAGKWVGKALDLVDKLVLSKIPIVKNFASAMRTLILKFKLDSGVKALTENKKKIRIKENFDFSAAYEELYPKVFRSICMKYSNGDREKAQDFCQNGFIKAYQKRDMYRGESLAGWISTIVRNNILDELRKEKIRPKSSSYDFGRLDTGEEEYDDLFMGKYTEKDIQDAMNTLSPAYQDTFRMYYFDDMSHQEIANKLGTSEGTSKSNLFKAKAKIKNYLEKLKRD